MKIVFDCRYTRIGRHDGISRYTAGLVTALAKLHPVTMLISDHRQLEMLPDLPWELVSAPTSANEPFVGDAQEWRYYRNTAETADGIPDEERIFLPSEPIAKLWGAEEQTRR